MLQLERPVEPGAERPEVVVLARLRPGLDPLGRELCHLRAEVGGDAARLLPVARCDRNEAGVVRLGIEPGDLGRRFLEQLPDLVADEQLVGETADRGEMVAAGLGAPARHHHELVPLEDTCGDDEVVDLRQLAPQGDQCV